MKRSLIHRGYFRELFRQLRTRGIVAALILLSINLIEFLIFLSADPSSRFVDPAGGGGLAWAMLIFLYVACPVLTFGAYRWLLRRVQSDFYHAIPLTRTQIYATTSLAVFLWLAIGLTVYAVTRALIYLVFGLAFNYLLFLCVYLNMLLCAITNLGALSIGCALSGTRFVSIFTSATILFFPREVLYLLKAMIEINAQSFVPLYGQPFFTNPSFNISAWPLYPLLYGIDYANVLAMLYSLLYGFLLLFLGGVLFKRRKSEHAGVPYTSKLMQGVVRVMVGSQATMGLGMLLNQHFFGQSDYNIIDMPDSAVVPLVCISLITSFVFYCLYELISSKRMKNVLKAMPFYPICIALGLVMLFVPTWIGLTKRDQKIDAADVKGYTVRLNESTLVTPYSLLFVGSENTYADLLTEQYTFTDREEIGYLARQYNGDMDTFSEYYSMKSPLAELKGAGLSRKFLRSDRISMRRLLDDQAFREAFYAYPKGTVWYSADGLTQEEAKEVGKAFREDYEKLSNEQRATLMTGRNEYLCYTPEPDFTSMTITIAGCCGTENYVETFRVTELTPNAAKLYLSYRNAAYGEAMQKQLKETVAWMENPDMQTSERGNYWIGGTRPYGPWNEWEYRWEYGESPAGTTPKDAFPEQYAVLKALSEAPLSDDPEHCVTIDFYPQYGINSERCYAAFEADDELKAAILQSFTPTA